MENQQTPYKRKVLFINPSFQLKFISFLILATFIAIFSFYIAQTYFFKQLFEEGLLMNLPKDHAYFSVLFKQKDLMDKVFLITGFFVFIFLFIFGLILSHRIAGPLEKLKNSLEDYSNGDKIHKLKFRKNDFFKDLADTFNKLIKD